MTLPRGKENKPPFQPFRVVGVVVMLIFALVLALVYLQFRGDFTPTTKVTVLSPRAGLVMDPGSQVTFNGVQIGRVKEITEKRVNNEPVALLSLDVKPRYIKLMPSNVDAKIVATTLFGGKYVEFSAPKNPSGQPLSKASCPGTKSTPCVDATHVTTEINTLFQTLTSITEKVDPVKVNLTLSAAADALNGLGDKFGQSIINANAVLDQVNPQMPTIRHDIQQLAALGDTYANAAPDLLNFLRNAATTAHTVHQQENELDQALLAATGFGNTGAEIFNKGGPYLARGAADLVPSAQLLDTYSPELFCTIRNLHDVEPKVAAFTSPYALRSETTLLSGLGLALNLSGIGGLAVSAPLTLGATGLATLVGGSPNPYVYPDNLPRINAHGGPGGAPGCWQTITRDLWPAPELVMDTGVSIAPYNHVDTGSPYAIEYVWGRQVGDYTINP
jgi:phospholipid/cholesterol/gamma-HCH transport system substrate-binding protein